MNGTSTEMGLTTSELWFLASLSLQFLIIAALFLLLRLAV